MRSTKQSRFDQGPVRNLRSLSPRYSLGLVLVPPALETHKRTRVSNKSLAVAPQKL